MKIRSRRGSPITFWLALFFLALTTNSHLNVDKAGPKQIMALAVGGGTLKQAVDTDAFADPRFATSLGNIQEARHRE